MEWPEPFDLEVYRKALLAAVVIGMANGYASAAVVLRRSALKIGSLSHSLLPGIALSVLLFGLTWWGAFVGAMVAALFVGLASLMVARGGRIDHETALGVFYTMAFSIGVVILQRLSLSQELEGWLLGNILALSNDDLWMALVIGAISVGGLTLFRRPLIITFFEPEVAATLSIPVRLVNYGVMTLLILVLITTYQAVGAILALGLLVAPGATMLMFTNKARRMFLGGGIIGALGASGGLWLSYWLDWPAGSTMVILLGGIFLVAFLLGPRYGLLGRRSEKHRH